MKRVWDKFGIISISEEGRNPGLFEYIAYLLYIGEVVVVFLKAILEIKEMVKG